MSGNNRILVTGGAGFIGSEFVRQAAIRGYSVGVVDCLTYAGDKGRLKSIQGRFQFLKANINNLQRLKLIFKSFKPAAVIHFAAETHVDRSILDARTSLETNVLGTQNLLEVSKQAGIKRFVHVSTDEVYGDIEKGFFAEDAPLAPSSPYSVGKAAADMLVKAHQRTYGFPAIIARPSNNYGPWQYPEKFMPVIIYKALRNQKIPVYGKGLNVREWLYVSDCANGIMAILEKGKDGSIYNIGSGNERPNIEVVKRVLSILKKDERLIQFVEDRPGHDIRYALDFSKMKNELGWAPKMSFEQGLQQTIEFYKSHMPWLHKKVQGLESYWKKVYRPAKAK